MENSENINVTGSFECLKETMSYYLKQENAKGKSVNWIVRDFEQIDGDVLQSASQEKDKVYHFACLSDNDMNVKSRDQFTWPLDMEFFEYAYEPLDWKYQVFVKSKKEYKNFKRYALIYGLQFNRVNFKLSYIKNAEGKENELYYMLRILGIESDPYSLKEDEVSLQPIGKIEITKQNDEEFNNFDVYKYNICKYKFALETLIEGGTKYKEKFLILKYYEILLENAVRQKLEDQPLNILKYYEILLENAVRQKLEDQPLNRAILYKVLDDEYDILLRKFRFVIKLDSIDIISNARRYIINEVLGSLKQFPKLTKKDVEYMEKKKEFIYLRLSKDNKLDENILKNKFKDVTEDKMKKMFSDEALANIKYDRECDEWCKYCANKEVCLESYKLFIE